MEVQVLSSAPKFSNLYCWPVEAGAPDRQFLSSAPKFLNLYCLARGGRSAGPSIPLFGTKNCIAGPWRPSAGPSIPLFGTKIFKSVLSGSWRPERRDAGSPGRNVVFSASNLEFLGSMVREGPILPTSKPAKCALCTLLAVDLPVSKIS